MARIPWEINFLIISESEVTLANRSDVHAGCLAGHHDGDYNTVIRKNKEIETHPSWDDYFGVSKRESQSYYTLFGWRIVVGLFRIFLCLKINLKSIIYR